MPQDRRRSTCTYARLAGWVPVLAQMLTPCTLDDRQRLLAAGSAALEDAAVHTKLS